MTASTTDWDLISSYAGLLSLATASIYAGSFGSLPSKRAKKATGEGEAKVEDDDEDEDITERLSSEDAWWFPIIGSVVLFGLYLVVRYLGKEWINWLLGWYFAIAGVGSIWQALTALTRTIMGNTRWKTFDRIKLSITKGSSELASLSIRTPSLFLFLPSFAPSILYTFYIRKSALLSNILALSFCYNALALLKLDSFKTGCILLAGLFFYDVWWVFGTEVMVKVATTLDVPIKLLWPKSTLFSTARGFTMLGLGDVVIPGIFVALALRYDYFRKTEPKKIQEGFSKPYFYAALVAYVAGLATTMGVMHTWGKAQPALLYLSPACISSFFITATLRGELKEAWAWSDAPEEAKEGGEKEGKINGGKEAGQESSEADGEGEAKGKGRRRRSKKKNAA